MLAGEELELLKHGYIKVFYLGYYCPTCGSCRVAVALPLDCEYISCGRCGHRRCRCGLLRVIGYTKHKLPLKPECWAAPLPEARFGEGDEDFPLPKRKPAKPPRVLDADHFINCRGKVCRLLPR